MKVLEKLSTFQLPQSRGSWSFQVEGKAQNKKTRKNTCTTKPHNQHLKTSELQFTFMHLSDAFIQSDLQYIQVIHMYCQYAYSLGIESTTFALLTQCSITEPQEQITLSFLSNVSYKIIILELTSLLVLANEPKWADYSLAKCINLYTWIHWYMTVNK